MKHCVHKIGTIIHHNQYYLKINTETATNEYAKSVAIDIISANSFITNMFANPPESKPEKIVPIKGVLVLELIAAKNLKITPSDPIEYNMRGNGNIAPNKEVDNPVSAPIDMIHLAACHPTAPNTHGKGAPPVNSELCSQYGHIIVCIVEMPKYAKNTKSNEKTILIGIDL